MEGAMAYRRLASSPSPAGARPLAEALPDWGPRPLPGALPAARSGLSRPQAEAAEQAAQAAAQGAGLSVVSSPQPEVVSLIKGWATKNAHAEAAGVDMRKAVFVSKLVSTVASLLTVGAAVALTVATAGAATPFLIIAATRTAVLIGDAWCARLDLQRSQETPPRPLPMGSNFLGNAVYGLVHAAGASPEASRTMAKYGSTLLSVGLVGASLAFALPTDAMDFSIAMMRFAAGMGGLLGAKSHAHAADQHEAVVQASVTAASDVLAALKAQAAKAGFDPEDFGDFCQDFRAQVAAQVTDEATLKALDHLLASARSGGPAGGPGGDSAVDPAAAPAGGDHFDLPLLLSADGPSRTSRRLDTLFGANSLLSSALTAFAHFGALR